jgi:TRAP-type C4-dicarboxylate transport system permease small subunit
MSEISEKTRPAFGKALSRAAENLLFVLFAVMVFIVFVNVVARYVFQSSIVESEELARYSFVWASFLGAVFALNEEGHIGVDMVVKKLPPSLQKVVLVFAYLCMLVFSALCVWYGYVLAESTFGWPSPATGIPYGYVGLIVPITFAAMLVIVIRKLVAQFRSKP